MDQYILILTIIGLAVFAMAWMPQLTERTGMSYAIIYVAFGALIFNLFPQFLPIPLPGEHLDATVRLTELVVIISLMGAGIGIDRSFSFKKWASPLRLLLITMPVCIALAACLGYSFLHMDWASAMLLGAVLAPTDPVLAADVQVGAPNDQNESDSKFALTAEAGLNDGLAFPFTWLAVVLALMASEGEGGLLNWFGYDFLYRIVGGLIVGFLIGRASGYLIFRLPRKVGFLKSRDGFISISLTLLVYGVTELIHGYGFIAVFICAITLRHFAKQHDFHGELHSMIDQTERFLIAVLLILFGGSLVSGILDALTWELVLFALGFIFLIRPFVALGSLYGLKLKNKEKIAISFFGIRGMGTVFYLAFALKQTDFAFKDELWAVAAFTILLSIVVHGLSATSVMKRISGRD